MVFYTEQQLASASLPYIPTELWFMIYKMEHQSILSEVHKEIIDINLELKRSNFNMMMDTMGWDDIGDYWTTNDIIAFSKCV